MKDFKQYNRIIHLSHIDADGYGCQMVSHMALSDLGLSDIVEYYNADYKDVEDRVKEIISLGLDSETLFIITDLNLTQDILDYIEMSRITHNNFNILLIDHHIVQSDISNISWYHLDTTMSATLATYKYFYGDDTPVPEWVYAINNADIYKKNTTEDLRYFLYGKVFSSFISRYISTLEFDFKVMKKANDILIPTLLYIILESHILDISNIGIFEENIINFFKSNMTNKVADENILSIRDLNHILYGYAPIDDILIALYLKYMLEDDLVYKNNLRIFNGKHKVLYFEQLQNANLISNILLERYKDVDLIITKGRNGVSFRSLMDRVDVSKVAKEFGGGGHPCASGCGMFEVNRYLA